MFAKYLYLFLFREAEIWAIFKSIHAKRKAPYWEELKSYALQYFLSGLPLFLKWVIIYFKLSRLFYEIKMYTYFRKGGVRKNTALQFVSVVNIEKSTLVLMCVKYVNNK